MKYTGEIETDYYFLIVYLWCHTHVRTAPSYAYRHPYAKYMTGPTQCIIIIIYFENVNFLPKLVGHLPKG